MCIEDQLKKNGFVSTQGLTDWQEQQLQASVRKGEAMRLIRLIVPNGILCLWSAWSVYNLTTQIPNAYYVAIKRSRKVVLPEYPEFQLIYQSDKLLSIGATRKEIQGYDVPIFDVERSVCDVVKYRNKAGIDVMAEVLQAYLKRPDKNISLLMDYASKLRIRNTLNHYLEAWL